MKTHTQYPYPITTFDQFQYAEKHNLMCEKREYDTRDFTVRVRVEQQMIDHDEALFTLVPKTIDELEVGDVVEYDDIVLNPQPTTFTGTVTKIAGGFVTFQEAWGEPDTMSANDLGATFSHPLPIALFPILDKK